MTPPTLQRLLITMPVLILPLALTAVTPAAAGVAAEEAVRILSRARTVDVSCNYLSGAERQELSRYAARAEIAAASQVSPAAARKAAAAGVLEGRAAACSLGLRADVRETLEAAREAVAAAGPSTRQPETTPARTTKSVKQSGTASRSSAVLRRYARIVETYYLERECKSLSKSKATRFWRGIVKLHKLAVARNGAGAVAPVMRSAERRARSSSCGTRALARIRTGYSEITSR